MASSKAALAFLTSASLNSNSEAHSTCYSAQSLSWLTYSSVTVVMNSFNMWVMASKGPPVYNWVSTWVKRVMIDLLEEKLMGYFSMRDMELAVARAKTKTMMILFIFFIY